MCAKSRDLSYTEKVMNCVRDTLENEIANDMWGVLKRNIITEVYGGWVNRGSWMFNTRHDSKFNGYQRRYSAGGLINEDDVYVEVSKNGESSFRLFVSTKAKPSHPVITGHTWDSNQEDGFGFIRLIEEGNLGFWTKREVGVKTKSRVLRNYDRSGNKERAFATKPFPRPFIDKAQEEANSRLSRYKKIIEKKVKLIKA